MEAKVSATVYTLWGIFPDGSQSECHYQESQMEGDMRWNCRWVPIMQIKTEGFVKDDKILKSML